MSFDATEKIVRLKTKDDKNITILLDKLSETDKQFVQQQSSKQGNDDENPFNIESQSNPTRDKLSKQDVTKLNELANLPHDVLIAKAEKNDADAQLELAIRYLIDYQSVLHRNEDNAVDWLQKGAKHAETGSVAGLICKGLYYDEELYFTKDWAETTISMNCYRKAAETGDPRGQLILGMKLISFTKNQPEEIKTEGINWIKKSVEQGYTSAYIMLGFAYFDGSGVSCDKTEGIKCIRKVAEQGDVKAQTFLGVSYFEYVSNEIDLPRDKTEGVKWLRKAAEHGYVLAQVVLYEFFHHDDYKGDAVYWCRKAAEQGDAFAQYSLGNCYKDGDGIPKDKEEAIKWFRKAAEQKNEDAIKALRELGIE
jgi:TPR repeat protein